MAYSLSDLLIGEPIRLFGNVHVVVPDVLYRSATLSARGLRYVTSHWHIRSVLNLRGAEPGERWYQTERRTLEDCGVMLIDFPMVDYLVPAPAEMAQLFQILQSATRPLLVHCRVGADRTGLACALFELTVIGKPPEAAKRQLTWRYGHVPWLDGRSHAMDVAFAQVAAGALDGQRASSGPS